MAISLSHRLLLFLRIFSRRPEVLVRSFVVTPPMPAAKLKSRMVQMPTDLAKLATEFDGLEFTWELVGEDPSMGGRIELLPASGLKFHAHSSSDESDDDDYDDDDDRDDESTVTYRAGADAMQDEGFTHWVYDEGRSAKQAHLEFEDANDCEISYMGGLEEYLTGGARRAFVWYWQRSYAESRGSHHDFDAKTDYGTRILKLLRASSIPTRTQHAMIARRLLEAGCTTAEASALHKWLGSDVTLLLSKDGLRQHTVEPLAKKSTRTRTSAKRTTRRRSKS